MSVYREKLGQTNKKMTRRVTGRHAAAQSVTMSARGVSDAASGGNSVYHSTSNPRRRSESIDSRSHSSQRRASMQKSKAGPQELVKFNCSPFGFPVFPLLTRNKSKDSETFALLLDVERFLDKKDALKDDNLLRIFKNIKGSMPAIYTATVKEKAWLTDHGLLTPQERDRRQYLINTATLYDKYQEKLLKDPKKTGADVIASFLKKGITLSDDEVARMYSLLYIDDFPQEEVSEASVSEFSLAEESGDEEDSASSSDDDRKAKADLREKPKRGRPRKYFTDSEVESSDAYDESDNLSTQKHGIKKRRGVPTLKEIETLHQQYLSVINHDLVELNHRRVGALVTDRSRPYKLTVMVSKLDHGLDDRPTEPPLKTIYPVALMPGQYQEVIPEAALDVKPESTVKSDNI